MEKKPVEKQIKQKEIFENINLWKEANTESWELGAEAIEFAEKGAQWEENTINRRRATNKETLVINQTKKHLKAVQARGKTIDLSLDVFPTKVDWEDDIAALSIYKKIVKSIVLHSNNLIAFEKSLDKVYSFGQSAIFVFVGRENDETLNKIPIVKSIEDPTSCFFDPKAPSLTKNDGRYCGLCVKMSRKEILSLYPKVDLKQTDEELTVVDYWFKTPKPYTFVKLTDGTFKREDLLTVSDKIVSKKSKEYDEKIINCNVVMHTRIIEGIDEPLEKEREYPGNNLPGCYNYGLTFWTEKGYESRPYIEDLKSPQIFHNYVVSQIATQCKNMTSDKYIGSTSHIESERAQKSAKDIMNREGFFAFDEVEGQSVQRLTPSPVAPGMAEIMMASEKELEGVAGVVNESTARMNALSGVAFNEMMKSSHFMQNNVIKAHIHTIHDIGDIIKSMIPVLFTEHRIIRHNNETVEINKRIDITNTVTNDISKLKDNFDYEIKSSVSTDLEKAAVLEELRQIYSIYPNAIPKTIDLYAKMLNTTYSTELALRMSLLVDPNIEHFTSGDISREKFEELEAQNQQKAQQAALAKQKLAQQSDPALQIEQQKLIEEQLKVKTLQFKAETERGKMMLQNEIAHAGLDLDTKKLLSSNLIHSEHADISRKELASEEMRTVMSHENAMIKAQ